MTHEEVLNEVNVIYERISNNENNLFSDGKYTEALEVLIDYYEVGFIEELEKIKAKMSDLDIVSTNGNNAKQIFLLTKDLMISVVNSRISELKGENNANSNL